jgi:hypothetical protein
MELEVDAATGRKEESSMFFLRHILLLLPLALQPTVGFGL